MCSTSRTVEAGVLQESRFLPRLLYTVREYVNDLSVLPNTKIALYTNNILLYASAKSNLLAVQGLQSQIKKIQQWFDQWKISTNPISHTKTYAIHFTTKHVWHIPLVKIKSISIKYSHYTRCLDVLIDKNLNFVKHVIHVKHNQRN